MSEFMVGIDLGTTHTVVAYAQPGTNSAGEVQVFPIPQLVAAGEVAARPFLPSVCYLYKSGELGAHDVVLPWIDVDATDFDGGQGIATRARRHQGDFFLTDTDIAVGLVL